MSRGKGATRRALWAMNTGCCMLWSAGPAPGPILSRLAAVLGAVPCLGVHTTSRDQPREPWALQAGQHMMSSGCSLLVSAGQSRHTTALLVAAEEGERARLPRSTHNPSREHILACELSAWASSGGTTRLRLTAAVTHSRGQDAAQMQPLLACCLHPLALQTLLGFASGAPSLGLQPSGSAGTVPHRPLGSPKNHLHSCYPQGRC